MYKKAKIRVEKIPDFLKAYGRKLAMTPGACPSFTYTISKEKNDAVGMIKECISVMETMKRILIDEDGGDT